MARQAARMALTSPWAVGSLAAVTVLTPFADDVAVAHHHRGKRSAAPD